MSQGYREHIDGALPPSIRFCVSPEAAGLPLADLVAAQVGRVDAATILAHGGVWQGRHRAPDATTVPPPGTPITIHTPPGGRYTTIDITPADMCYEDAWLLALNKRAGWYTTPTPWDAHNNIRVALARFLRQRDGGDPAPHLAHQLDRDTSGVLLCTKERQANAPLQVAFDRQGVHKHYLGICAGEPADTAFEVRTGHGRGHSGLWRLYDATEIGATLPNGSRVKLAHTGVVVERRLGGAALLRITLRTGRTHQIRLHLASVGHPLLGDGRYGGPATFGGHTLAGHLLHAAHMHLTRHPVTHQPLDLYAPLPQPMAALLQAHPQEMRHDDT
jgi:23S rRNA pseudouridine1911/1915/1917 synthase